MTAAESLALASLDLLGAMSPGPNVVLVAGVSANASRRNAVGIAAGVAAASATWAAAAILSISAVRVASSLKWLADLLCGGYLVILAFRMWSVQHSQFRDADRLGGMQKHFLRGFGVGLSNPKVVLFYVSIVAGLNIDLADTFNRVAGLGTIVFTELIWYVSLALMVSRLTQIRQHIKLLNVFRIVGIWAMLAVGFRLLFAGATGLF